MKAFPLLPFTIARSIWTDSSFNVALFTGGSEQPTHPEPGGGGLHHLCPAGQTAPQRVAGAQKLESSLYCGEVYLILFLDKKIL